MFAHAFQGGPSVLVLDSKDKKSHEKLFKAFNGQTIKQEFDQNTKEQKVKYNCLNMINKIQVQFRLQRIGLIIFEFNSFFIDLVITDTTNRRINLTSNYQKITSNLFHAQIPNDIIKRGIWMNLSIDVHSFMQIFKGFTFRSLDQIILGSSCKLRRIFTMKNPLVQTSLEDNERNQYNAEHVPKNISLPSNLEQMNQLVSFYDIILKQSQQTINKSIHQSYIGKSPEKNRNSSFKNSNNINNSIVLTPVKNKTPNQQLKKTPTKIIKDQKNQQEMQIIPEKVQLPKNQKNKSPNKKLLSAQQFEFIDQQHQENKDSESLDPSSKFNTISNLTSNINYNQSSLSNSNKLSQMQQNGSKQQSSSSKKSKEQIEEKIEQEKRVLDENKKSQIFDSCVKDLINNNLRPSSPEFQTKNIQKIKKTKKHIQQMVQLQYDPVLKQYFDPTTNQYYQNIDN